MYRKMRYCCMRGQIMILQFLVKKNLITRRFVSLLLTRIPFKNTRSIRTINIAILQYSASSFSCKR